LHRASGEHHNFYFFVSEICPEPSQHFLSVKFWKEKIQQDSIRCENGNGFKRFLSLFGQNINKKARNMPFIVNDQNSGGAGRD